MNRLSCLLTAAAVVFAAGSAGAACNAPGPAPAIPDGSTATLDQMKAAQKEVQAYVNVLQTYQDCMEQAITEAPKDMSPEDKQKMREQGNNAVDQATALSAAYSAQAKLFTARPKN